MARSPFLLKRNENASRFLSSLLLALGAHVSLVGISVERDPKPAGPSEPAQEFEIDFVSKSISEDDGGASSTAQPQDPIQDENETLGAENEKQAARKGKSPSSETTADVAPHVAPDSNFTQAAGQGEGKERALVDSGASSKERAASGKRLSLAQLGIGAAPRIPVPDLGAREKNERQETEERLRRSLAQGLSNHDTEVGLGPQGEVRGALLRATREERLTERSAARLLVLLGEGGGVTTVTVLSSTSLEGAWKRIAQSTKVKLSEKELRLSPNEKGAELRFFVEHDYRLPSGRPRGRGQEDPHFKGLSYNKAFDVADIGQGAQPVVRARLEQFRVF